ncbi:MAG: hypothetical protein AAF985_02150 [Bacteroidota bacterium]
MKSTLKYFSFVLVTLLLGGCFEIKEEVNVNNDGSGDLVLTIDMSASKENLANFMRKGEINGVKIPDQNTIEQEITRLKKVLKETKGISEVKSTSDYEAFVFTLSGNFTNTKALNKAINRSIAHFNEGLIPVPKKDNFGFSSNQFTRYFKYRLRKGLYEKLDFGTRFVLDAARLTSIYRFKRPVKSVSNPNAQLSANSKAVRMSSSLAEIVRKEVTVANDISF